MLTSGHYSLELVLSRCGVGKRSLNSNCNEYMDEYRQMLEHRSSASQVSLDGPTTSSQSPNHDRQVELRCRGTISVEQSSCCSTETRDDSAHFQETTEGLSVPHLMCWQTEETFTTARHCCGVILALDTKMKTYFLT